MPKIDQEELVLLQIFQRYEKQSLGRSVLRAVPQPVSDVDAKFNRVDYWTSHNGTRTRIRQMETTHLMNTVIYVKRKAVNYYLKYYGQRTPIGLRDYRRVQIEADTYYHQRLSKSPLYITMIAELKRRLNKDDFATFERRLLLARIE